jgi:hypothetical protein
LFLSNGKASPVFDVQLLPGDMAAGVPVHPAPGAFQWTEQAVMWSATPLGSLHPPLLSVLRI